MEPVDLVNHVLMGLRYARFILSHTYDKTTTHGRAVLEFHPLNCDLSQKLFIAYHKADVVLIKSPAPLSTIASQYRCDDFDVSLFNHHRV